MSECSDAAAKFYPFRAVCYATMEQQAAWAMYQQLHEEQPYHNGTFTSWAQGRSASHPYHYADGVKVAVADRDVAPDDKFTTDRFAKPSV